MGKKVKVNNCKCFWSFLTITVLVCIMIYPMKTMAMDTGMETVNLRKSGKISNTVFSVDNMFPGDVITKDMVIEVSHKKPVILYYQADIRPGYEKLAEVLQVKITLAEQDEILYEGLLKDMPKALEHKMDAAEKEVIYRIAAHLDTSVGNEYQFKSLIADFRWWYTKEPENDLEMEDRPESGDDSETGDNPETGDHADITGYVSAMAGAFVITVFLLVFKQRKEEER